MGKKWLRTLALVSQVLLVASAARGDDRVASKFSAYVDDDATEVFTAVVAASKDAWKNGSLSATYVVDAISSASVDVVSHASPRFRDTRHAASLAGQHQWEGDDTNRTWLGLSYGFSRENDYQGHALGLNLRRELFARNTVLSLSYQAVISTIGRAKDDTFARSLNVHNFSIGLSQVLSRSLIGSIRYVGALHRGYNASPYLHAKVGALVPGVCRACPPDRLPNLRSRNSILLQIKKHLVAECAIEASYRFYLDTWGMIANMAELRLFLGWTEHFYARLRYRFYRQSATSFYRDVYRAPVRYMTGDRELSRLMSNLAGVKLRWQAEDLWVFDALAFDVKGDIFQYDYYDYSALPRRQGFIAEAGLEARF